MVAARPDERDGARMSYSPRQYVAFNESKTAREWSEDPRCVVSHYVLKSRLASRWGGSQSDIEAAITTPGRNPVPLVTGRTSTRTATAFGETKSLISWSQDPRCKTSLTSLYKRLEKPGVDAEHAITTPMRECEPEYYTCFGDSMTLAEWARDGRCCVPYSTLKTRIARKWPISKALTMSPSVRDLSEAVEPMTNRTPSRTYTNAGTARADGNLMKFSEPARGAAAMYAYQLPSKGLST
jgi:hypothetical protein